MADVQTKIGLDVGVSGARTSVQEIGSVYRELRAGTMTVKEGNAALREYGATIRAQNRAVGLLRAEYRASNATMLEGMRTMRSISSIGRTITRTFTAYTLMQTRVADQTRDVRDSEENLATVQANRQRIVADLGANNALALRLMTEEERLTKRLTAEKLDLKRAQDQNIMGYVGMGLELIGIIPKLASTHQALSGLRGILGETWAYTSLTGIVTNLGSVTLAAAEASTAVALLISAAAGLAAVGAMLAPDLLLGGAETETPMSELLPEGMGLTQEELKQGLDYVNKYTDWRASQIEQFLAENFPSQYFKPWDTLEGGGGGGGGGGANVDVDGDDVDVDVQVDVTVKPKPPGGGGGGKFR